MELDPEESDLIQVKDLELLFSPTCGEGSSINDTSKSEPSFLKEIIVDEVGEE